MVDASHGLKAGKDRFRPLRTSRPPVQLRSNIVGGAGLIDRNTAISLATTFLRENAPGAEPLSVRSEEDGWIVSARLESGDTVLVYLDIDDAEPKFYSEEVVDVDLRRPQG